MSPKKRSREETLNELRRLAGHGSEDRDRLTLLHDLQVYHEELVAQNDALMKAQAALEETRDRFIELYDFAPNGYLTLDGNGIVIQINLTGATILGKPRHAIEGLPLFGFVADGDRALLLEFLRQCRRTKTSAEISVELIVRSR